MKMTNEIPKHTNDISFKIILIYFNTYFFIFMEIGHGRLAIQLWLLITIITEMRLYIRI